MQQGKSKELTPLQLQDDVMEICGSLVLEFFSVKDTALLAAISKDWQQLSHAEIKRRSEKWVQETSRAWEWRNRAEFDELQMEVSADEVADEKRALDGLDNFWKDHFERPSDMLREVARWNGGWPRFLHSREQGAKPQPEFERGRRIEFTTLGPDPYPHRPFALLYDIRCDGRHKWSGFQPFNEDDLGQVGIEGMSCVNTWPISTNTLGDKADSSIIFPFSHHVRVPKFLFSTHINDDRSWEVSVSIVSPFCSETLLLEFRIATANILIGVLSDEDWDKDAGFDENDEHIELRPQYARNIQRDGWYKDYDIASAPPGPVESMSRYGAQVVFNDVRGLRDNGCVTTFENLHANCVYWLDKRNPEREMLHMNMNIVFEDELCSDMILNPSVRHRGL